MLTRDLFNKFLNNECSKQELEYVSKCIDEHPGLLDDWMPEEEFVNIDFQEEESPGLEHRLLTKISRETYRTKVISIAAKKWLVAATLILAAGIGWKYLESSRFFGNTITIAENKINNEPIWQNFTSSEKSLQVTLPDSSIVELSSYSNIKYNSFFSLNGKRNIYLSGKAFFKVTKDKTKPFSVYSRGIVTTAVGTSFTIDAVENSNVISIMLHTGKVSVKSTEILGKTVPLNKYLYPGDKFFYYLNTKHSIVKRLERKSSGVTAHNNNTGNIYKPQWYKFEGQPLAEVLDQLSFYYEVEIEYNKAEISKDFMSAKFGFADSIDKIITDIATLNNLVVKKLNGKYFLKKAAH